jgi:hypothetical protein
MRDAHVCPCRIPLAWISQIGVPVIKAKYRPKQEMRM